MTLESLLDLIEIRMATVRPSTRSCGRPDTNVEVRRMPTILCVEDSTFRLSHLIRWLSHNGYFVLGRLSNTLRLTRQRNCSLISR
jgi:hypothetical protein